MTFRSSALGVASTRIGNAESRHPTFLALELTSRCRRHRQSRGDDQRRSRLRRPSLLRRGHLPPRGSNRGRTLALRSSFFPRLLADVLSAFQQPPAPAPPAAKNGSTSSASPNAPSPSIPGPGQPPLSYDALKALIESQPVLINQLPAQYQQHFGQLLKIPVPYPTSASPAPPAAKPSPTAQPAPPIAPNPVTAPAPSSAPQVQPPAPSVGPSASAPALSAAPSSHPLSTAAPQGVSLSHHPPAAAFGNGSA
jgi:hypothetical protein